MPIITTCDIRLLPSRSIKPMVILGELLQDRAQSFVELCAREDPRHTNITGSELTRYNLTEIETNSDTERYARDSRASIKSLLKTQILFAKKSFYIEGSTIYD